MSTLSDAPAASSPAVEPTPAPVPATDQAVALNEVTAYRTARRAERTGTPLSTPPAESSPAQPGDQAASTDATAKPASEPGAPTDKGKGKGAKARSDELEADIRDLQEKLRLRKALREEFDALGVRPDGKPAADSSPVAPADGKVVYPPDLTTFDAYLAAHPDGTYEEFVESRVEFKQDARQKAAEQTKASEQAETTRVQRLTKFDERLTAAGGPEFLATLSPEVVNLKPFDTLGPNEKPSARNAIAQHIVESPVGPQLMRHFSDHPEDLRRLERLGPAQLLVEIGKVEAKVESVSQKPAADPPTKPVTEAPRVPPTLGTRPAAPADELTNAEKTNDVGAYRRARLRQRIAALRGQ